jgi:hypothetical protein
VELSTFSTKQSDALMFGERKDAFARLLDGPARKSSREQSPQTWPEPSRIAALVAVRVALW